ncbi:hypothetical protein STAS_18325 [Striga asiatica]|uniref:Uncharacterized protein n=1 Tax=Striga asiatica TaxID=4170 RepID=A0A5A7Q8S4_STRAF|nr:hypothetical protein STAS_18325 [Striga asiatica]
MGNQNTSGIVAEQKVSEKDDEVCSPHDQQEQSWIANQEEDERSDFQEKTDSDSDEANESLENPAFGSEKASLPKVPNDEAIFEEKILNNEIQDQSFTLDGDMQEKDSNPKPKCTSNVDYLDPLPQESTDINNTSEPQEDQTTMSIVVVEKHEHENDNVTADIVSANEELSEVESKNGERREVETETDSFPCLENKSTDKESILINNTNNVDKICTENEPVIEDNVPKVQESAKTFDKSRKCPSFDFGLPFDARSDESSDQTPLLFQDMSRIRSLPSSCSTLKFQHRSVKTEYFGNSLHFESAEVEEKTIRMERSHSDGLKRELITLNSMSKPENADVFVTKPKGESSVHDDVISSKGREKRKGRPSIFTSCICCTYTNI